MKLRLELAEVRGEEVETGREVRWVLIRDWSSKLLLVAKEQELPRASFRQSSVAEKGRPESSRVHPLPSEIQTSLSHAISDSRTYHAHTRSE